MLVFRDLVGIQSGFAPKFVKRYASVGDDIRGAVTRYCKEVKERTFPGEEHCFKVPEEKFAALTRR